MSFEVELRWKCPTRWVRDCGAPEEVPALLWGQDGAKRSLDLLINRAREGRPRHLVLSTPDQPGYPQAVGAYLRANRVGDRPVRVGLAVTAELLRGRRGPGLLAAAHEGYLVLETEDIIQEEGAWAALREAILRGRVCRTPDEPGSGENNPPDTEFASEPASDPAGSSLILVGTDLAFKKLCEVDRRIPSLFPRRTILELDYPRNPKGAGLVIRRLQRHLLEEGLGTANSGALAWLVEEACRLAPRRERLSLDLRELFGLLEEAREEQAKGALQKNSLQTASAARAMRFSGPERRHRERVARGQTLLQTEGLCSGVVNGLMVYGSGLSSYAVPGRITARTFLGREGLINVEREAKYSGRSFDKGIFLLGGFLKGKFARNAPLGLGAVLAFEQSYGKVDGDSATLAEAVALISELAALPCRQDLAVTGAINQRGDVLPVGSLNKKIEGWWASCRDRGITGEQGVVFPRASAPDLQLSEELCLAVEEGNFHLFPVEHLDQALSLFLGQEAGVQDDEGAYPKGSVYWRAASALRAMSHRLHPPRSKPSPKTTTAIKGPAPKATAKKKGTTSKREPQSKKKSKANPEAN